MVERGGLENRCPFAGTGGSNPSLSDFSNALLPYHAQGARLPAIYEGHDIPKKQVQPEPGIEPPGVPNQAEGHLS